MVQANGVTKSSPHTDNEENGLIYHIKYSSILTEMKI